TISDVATGTKSPKDGKAAAGLGGMIDPMQLWGSLTQQFQQIAASAIKEATTKNAVDMTKEAMKSAKAAGIKAVAKRTTARKTPAKRI
ncbi:MAG: hypothetical protein RIR45_1238, partial [Pseudomonadota bacterium]